MAVGEFALGQAITHVAQTLEHIRVICDRAHEEHLLAPRGDDMRALAVHFAFTLGTVMQIATDELEALRRIGVRRSEGYEQTNARALASLEAFKRAVRALEPPS